MTAFFWNSTDYESIATIQRIAAVELLEKANVLGVHRFTHDGLENVRSALDIGCGTGFLPIYLAKRLPNSHVLGVDLSPAMVERAREAVAKEGLSNVQIHQLDAALLDFTSEFDLVISNAAFHWVSDSANLLERIFRSLRPRGKLVAQFPLLNEAHPMVHTMNRAIASAGLQEQFRSWTFPWFCTTPEAYKELLLSKGFQVSICEESYDDAHLTPQELLNFLNAVGLPLYFAELPPSEVDRLRLAVEKEAAAILAERDGTARFIRLFTMAHKPSQS